MGRASGSLEQQTLEATMGVQALSGNHSGKHAARGRTEVNGRPRGLAGDALASTTRSTSRRRAEP
eukprot:5799027-Pyramimonas_sp.AAC.1